MIITLDFPVDPVLIIKTLVAFWLAKTDPSSEEINQWWHAGVIHSHYTRD